MSRKKFIESVESLFGEDDSAILSEESVLLSGKSAGKKRSAAIGRSSHGKNFSSDLENFLEESFEESFEEQLQQSESKPPEADAQIKKRPRRPSGGLDALIRSTVAPSQIEYQEKPTRRITLLFDQKKLERLKTIARLERTYLKDIIDDIVEDFLKSYREKNDDI